MMGLQANFRRYQRFLNDDLDKELTPGLLNYSTGNTMMSDQSGTTVQCHRRTVYCRLLLLPRSDDQTTVTCRRPRHTPT